MKQLDRTIRLLFFIFVRAVVLVVLGLNVRRSQLLPKDGPAIIVANHNSHLDTMVLISMFPLRLLPKITAIAAVDYFLKNPLLAWFTTRVIGITPIERGKASKSYDPLQPCCEALDRGKIIILFPEGTRGEPEHISQFKKGVAFLAERYPTVPVIPVFMYGLGKALPKGDFVLVPFFCDVFVGVPLFFQSDKNSYMKTLNEQFQAIAEEGHFPLWE